MRAQPRLLLFLPAAAALGAGLLFALALALVLALGFAASFALAAGASGAEAAASGAALVSALAAAALLGANLRPKRPRLPLAGAAASSAWHSSSVRVLGSRSFGTRAFLALSVT